MSDTYPRKMHNKPFGLHDGILCEAPGSGSAATQICGEIVGDGFGQVDRHVIYSLT